VIRLTTAALIAASLFISGCRKQAADPAQERWAVLLFDDLSAETSHRWLRRGIPEQLGRQLRHPPRLVTLLSQPDPQASRAAAIAGGVTHVLRGNFRARGGALQIQVEIEDVRQGKPHYLNRSASGDPVSAIAALALEIDPAALKSPVKSAVALEAYAQALDEGTPEVALGSFRRAIEVDPDFGAAYLGMAAIAVTSGRANQALEGLRQGVARKSLSDEIDRSQIAAEIAALTGDRAALATAIEHQAHLMASDAQSWARAAEAWLRARRPEKGATALTQAVKLNPANTDYWNQLGYARAYQGDLKGADEAFDRYRALRPGDPNALDSRGDVYYYNNRYAEAANYYRESFKLNPNFFNGVSLLKAAYATLWTGNIDAAGRIFAEYRRSRENRNDQASPIVNAEWLFFSGKRTEALQVLDSLAAQWTAKRQGALASRASSLAAIWLMALGEPAKAQVQARKAREAAGGSSVEAMSLFLTLPPAPPTEWIARAQRMFPANAPATLVTPILATALIFGDHFESALPYLDQWAGQVSGQPGDFGPVLKAWALFKLGRVDEAANLVRFTPLIPATGLPPVANLAYPRLFFLRARVAEKQGKQEEARRLDQLFLKLSGDRDKIFGEEAISRQKTGG
jgi:tetratricopeptide (TPR) repeat protein